MWLGGGQFPIMAPGATHGDGGGGATASAAAENQRVPHARALPGGHRRVSDIKVDIPSTLTPDDVITIDEGEGEGSLVMPEPHEADRLSPSGKPQMERCTVQT